MIDGKVIFLCQTIQQIQAAISSWEHYPDQAQDLPFDAKQHAADLYPLQELLRHQDIYQDDDLHWRIVKLRNELKNNLLFPPPSLIREFQNLYDQLMCALGRHRFAYIPEAAVPYFENEKLFGESVYNKFPDLREDIKDAGNCFAAALYTACVFHLMRIAEYGMRRIAIRVGVSLRDNKK